MSLKDTINKLFEEELPWDKWQVGDYIHDMGKVVKITPTAIHFINDKGQKSIMSRSPMPPEIAKNFDVKQSKGKLHSIDDLIK